jgi:hypothetical protein
MPKQTDFIYGCWCPKCFEVCTVWQKFCSECGACRVVEWDPDDYDEVRPAEPVQ